MTPGQRHAIELRATMLYAFDQCDPPTGQLKYLHTPILTLICFLSLYVEDAEYAIFIPYFLLSNTLTAMVMHLVTTD
jgi:hypothetical protein